MWLELRRRQLRGFRFRREHPIGRFILDFYCAEKRVAVEIDGPTHDADADERRDALLAAHGVRVVRFFNEEVYRDMAGCLEGLGDLLESRPSFPRAGGRTRRRRAADLSSNGECFDIGNTVSHALAVYRSSGDPLAGPTAPDTAGNGSLMRLAPVVLFYHPDRQQAVRYAAESSRTTHGAEECVDACAVFAELLLRALSGAAPSEILSPVPGPFCTPALDSIARMEFLGKSRSEIRGSGYVVHALEAALWCFGQAEAFDEAVLLAANLGEDADTTAAICGQLAGCHYGKDGIPRRWLDRLAMRDEIETLADRLLDASP